MNYTDFIETKRRTAPEAGFSVDAGEINASLFSFQRDIVLWALKRGRAAIWLDCGLGKSPIQLEWCHQVSQRTTRPVLILAPLAVSKQFQREGEKFGIPVTVCRTQNDVRPGVNVTNYEKLDHFDSSMFGGVSCDESSVLKGSGPLKKSVCGFADLIPYRLACTATPAPNDTEELTNHSEFLGIMRADEVLSLYFIQDGNTTHKWKIKDHARKEFWKWLASWAVALRKPSDAGYADEGFALPALTYLQHAVDAPMPSDALFQAEAHGLNEQRRVRKVTLTDRCERAADLANTVECPHCDEERAEREDCSACDGLGDSYGDTCAKCCGLGRTCSECNQRADECECPCGMCGNRTILPNREPVLVWCDLNAESAMLKSLIPDAVEIKGADSEEWKEKAILGFLDGTYRALIGKPSMIGHGLNLQHCNTMVFVGLGNSFEQYYQAVRRCWRFGQQRPVTVHVVTSEADGPVVRNIERKEKQAAEMMSELINEMSGIAFNRKAEREDMDYDPQQVMKIPHWLEGYTARRGEPESVPGDSGEKLLAVAG